MRKAGIIVVLLAIVAVAACFVDGPTSSKSSGQDQYLALEDSLTWRRTINGWERIESWDLNQDSSMRIRWSQLHPAVLALLLLLTSCGVLIAFAPERF